MKGFVKLSGNGMKFCTFASKLSSPFTITRKELLDVYAVNATLMLNHVNADKKAFHGIKAIHDKLRDTFSDGATERMLEYFERMDNNKSLASGSGTSYVIGEHTFKDGHKCRGSSVIFWADGRIILHDVYFGPNVARKS